MATLRTRGLCALSNVSNSPPPKRTKRTKAISTCEDFEDSKDSDDGACAPKKKRKTKVCEDCKQTQASFGLPPAKAKRWCSGCAKEHPEAESLNTKRTQKIYKDIAFVRFAGSTQGGVRKRRGVMAPRPTGVHAAHAILGVAMPITDAPPFDFF